MSTGGPAPSVALARNPFAAIAAATVFWRYILHDRESRRRFRMLCATALLSIIVLVVAALNREPAPLPLLDLLVAHGVAGALGFLIVVRQTADRESCARAREQLLTALLLPLSASMVSFGLWASSHLNPVYDGRIRVFEQHLGVSFSLLGVHSYQALLPLGRLASVCYAVVAIGLAIVAALQRTERREYDVLTASVVAGAAGFALYFVCPVVGPLESFGPAFPATLPALSPGAALLTVAAGPPRNGMPSLHTVWALLLWFNAERLSAGWKRGMRLFVILTLWAALGLDGQHWITDLIVAAPLAVAVQLACVAGDFADRRVWIACASCVALVAAWLACIRSGLLDNVPGPAAWGAIALTAWWSLARAARHVHRERSFGSESERADPAVILTDRERPPAVA